MIPYVPQDEEIAALMAEYADCTLEDLAGW